MKEAILRIADPEAEYSIHDFNREFSITDMKPVSDYKFDLKFENKSTNPNPEYATAGSSGMDLRANLDKEVWISSDGGREIIPTGLFFEIPENFEIQIRPRSGLAAKYGVTVLNTPGTIDCVPKDTKISTPTGYKLSQDIFNSSENEIILSYNEDTKSIEEDFITDSWIVNDLEMLEIETEEGDFLKIPSTKEVLTENGWKLAINLTIDDKILKIS